MRLSSGRGIPSWKLEPSGVFSTGSLYKENFKTAHRCEVMGIWKARSLRKLRYFVASGEESDP